MRSELIHSLILDELTLTVAPVHPVFKAALAYEYKTLKQNPNRPWIRATRREDRDLFRLETMRGIECLVTHHGFWRMCRDLCEKHGLKYRFIDRRLPFPAPRLEKMYGFRFSQRPLLTKLLLSGYSGCLKAPTRFGKSTLIVNTLRAYAGVCTVVIAPGEDLLAQTTADLKAALPERNIVQIGGGSSAQYPSEDITVCSMDSLHRCEHGRVRLILIDEPHAAMTDGRITALNEFRLCRRLAFGATLEGRYDQRDLVLTGLLGPVLAERTYQEAVAEGAICPIVVLMLVVKLSAGALKGRREDIYNHVLFENREMAGLIYRILEGVPHNWQSMVFIKRETQAVIVQEVLGGDIPIAMAKRMKKKPRRQLALDLRNNEIMRCISSDILATGVTFHDIRLIINAGGGGENISCIQKPGRLAEVRPGKKCGVMIDFFFEDPSSSIAGHDEGRRQSCMMVDSGGRRNAYRKKGFDLRIVHSVEELHQHIKACQ